MHRKLKQNTISCTGKIHNGQKQPWPENATKITPCNLNKKQQNVMNANKKQHNALKGNKNDAMEKKQKRHNALAKKETAQCPG